MRYVERPLYDRESVLIPRKGTLNNVMYVNQPFWSVDTIFYTEMRMPNIAKFIYHFVKNKNLASMNAGSAVPSMTTDILNAMEIAIPPSSELEKFETIVSPMYYAIQKNNIQSAKLADLRDLLLPQLMSGKINVSNIQILAAKLSFILLFKAILSSILPKISAIFFCVSKSKIGT